MKHVISIAAILLLAIFTTSCGKKIQPEAAMTIEGQWELSDYTTKSVNVGGLAVNVYLEFTATEFKIYQKIGEGRYRKFEGSYTLAEKILDGKYSDGKSFGSKYSVTKEGTSLKLTTEHETYTYKSTTIPAEVIDNAV